VVGMQQLYDAIRAAGAENLVVIGGLDYAYDLTGVPGSRIKGHNIMYATHPYNNGSQKRPLSWDSYWGFLTKTDPVIVTEFGDSAADCPSMYSSDLIAYADKHHVSWTAWAWFPGGCMFPSIITDWNGTPNQPGAVVKAALEAYDDPAAGGMKGGGESDAGAGAGDDAGTPAVDAGVAPDDAGAGAGDDAGDDAGV
jgi:endoglucanase